MFKFKKKLLLLALVFINLRYLKSISEFQAATSLNKLQNFVTYWNWNSYATCELNAQYQDFLEHLDTFHSHIRRFNKLSKHGHNSLTAQNIDLDLNQEFTDLQQFPQFILDSLYCLDFLDIESNENLNNLKEQYKDLRNSDKYEQALENAVALSELANYIKKPFCACTLCKVKEKKSIKLCPTCKIAINGRTNKQILTLFAIGHLIKKPKTFDSLTLIICTDLLPKEGLLLDFDETTRDLIYANLDSAIQQQKGRRRA